MRIDQFRRPAVVLFELVLVTFSNYLAFWLRFDGDIPSDYYALLRQMLPIVLISRAVFFVPFRLYEGLWRYTSLWDLRNIVAAVCSSTVGIYAIMNFKAGLHFPRSVFLIDTLLLIVLMTGIRLTRRIYREMWGTRRERGVLVYGAGDAGEMIVRDMKNNPFYRMEPVGFVDDDVKKVGRTIHGVRVLGTRHDLTSILTAKNVHEVLIAMPKATPAELRQVIKALEPFKISITTLPSLRDLLDRKVTVSEVRRLQLEDLLQRAPVGLDAAPVQKLIAGKRVMVTGAGGSIGAELCRQVLQMQPDALVLLDRHEPSLYSIHKDLQKTSTCRLIAKITDVTDRRGLQNVFAQTKPHIVFHAAAHKQVPLMELNVCEVVKNNIRGTRILTEEARRASIDRFILISTDKAVNPVSVMGATKRVAEFLVQSAARHNTPRFNVVRFGNVLGSAGSVVPLFIEQIKAGGPVTVTDPEMRRYFMLIPEAVHLVLHAAALGEPGVIYVLDMGDEFKVVDLARNLIRLSGYVPEEEISIEFIGLRPGEKLSEMLVGADETVEPSSVDKISRVRSGFQHVPAWLESQVLDLEVAAVDGRTSDAIRLLREIVPTYEPQVEGKHTQTRTASNVG